MYIRLVLESGNGSVQIAALNSCETGSLRMCRFLPPCAVARANIGQQVLASVLSHVSHVHVGDLLLHCGCVVISNIPKQVLQHITRAGMFEEDHLLKEPYTCFYKAPSYHKAVAAAPPTCPKFCPVLEASVCSIFLPMLFPEPMFCK